jgi:hypothetical protein
MTPEFKALAASVEAARVNYANLSASQTSPDMGEAALQRARVKLAQQTYVRLKAHLEIAAEEIVSKEP